MWLVWW